MRLCVDSFNSHPRTGRHGEWGTAGKRENLTLNLGGCVQSPCCWLQHFHCCPRDKQNLLTVCCNVNAILKQRSQGSSARSGRKSCSVGCGALKPSLNEWKGVPSLAEKGERVHEQSWTVQGSFAMRVGRGRWGQQHEDLPVGAGLRVSSGVLTLPELVRDFLRFKISGQPPTVRPGATCLRSWLRGAAQDRTQPRLGCPWLGL